MTSPVLAIIGGILFTLVIVFLGIILPIIIMGAS